ncbi:MAG: histidinol-phosphate transaminase [Alphaproteobacteria bacterium]|nr:histidinol-phosphate transaminase [Alphaproteobacteria bacterium]
MKSNVAKVLAIAETAGATRRGWLMLAGGASVAALAAGCAPAAAAPDPAPAAPTPAPTGPAIMSSNESPFGPSPMAQEAMRAAVSTTNRYADGEMGALARMIAEREGVLPEQIAVANGSSPLLAAFAEMIAQKGKGQLVTSMATYESVPRTVEQYGAEVIYTPLKADMNFDLDAMAAKLSVKTTASYVCNPNNPTGKMVDPAALKAFAIEAAKTAPVFLDEAYLDLAVDNKSSNMAGLVREGHNVVVCRTFSKLYAMAGQRIGYAIMPAEMARKMQGSVRMGGVNHLGLVAAMASLKDAAYYEEMRVKIAKGRNELVAMAKAVKRPIAEDPQGNFIFMDTGMPHKEFAEKMMAEGVKVVGRTWPGYDSWTRICVGLDWEQARCAEALKKVYTV